MTWKTIKGLPEIERENNQKNNDWEVLLREICTSSLKSSIDADEFCDTILDDMHTGEAYESADGTPFYYEIGKAYTASGLPVVVSAPELRETTQ